MLDFGEEEQNVEGDSLRGYSTNAEIWLLPRGSRGEVQPFAALGVALQKAGFGVKAFGVGCHEKLFTAFGVPFERTDRSLIFRNEEVLRQMREKAEALGLPSLEDYLGSLQQRKHEFLSFFSMKSWKEHTPTTKYMTWLNGIEATYDLLWHGPQEFNFTEWSKWEQERYAEYLQAQATFHKTNAIDFELVLEKRRQAYVTSLRAVAAEYGRTLQDFAELVHNEFNQHISKMFSASFTSAGGSGMSRTVVKELMSFNAWQFDACNLEDYWSEWKEKLPGLNQMWHESGTAFSAKYGQLQTWNILATARSLAPADKPDLVLFPASMLIAALELYRKHGLNVVLATARPPVLSSPMQQMLYSVLTMEEKATGLSNLQELGPVAFSDILRSPRQLFGTGPDELPAETALPKVCKSSQQWLDSFKANLHGHWHFTAEQELQVSEAPELFGGQEAKELLEGFLAQSKERPVYIGFGSTPHPEGPKALAKLVVGALRLANRRGIFFSSWGRMTHSVLEEALREVDNGPPSEQGDAKLESLAEFAAQKVLFLKAAPHEWLFPQCACIVHQPGVGTTDAALRSGVPQVQTEAMGGNVSSLTKTLIERLHVGKVLQPGLLGQLQPRQLANAVTAVMGIKVMNEVAEKVGASYRCRFGIARSIDYLGRDLLEDGPGHLLQGTQDELVAGAFQGQVLVSDDIYGRESTDYPWADGLYHMYTGKGEFGGRLEIQGCKVCVIGLEGPFCWLRAISDTEVEGFFQSSVDSAQLTEDGECFKWGSGQEFHLKHFMNKSCEKTCECAIS